MESNIINLTKTMIDNMLNENPVDGKELTAINITGDDLKIYTGKEVTEGNLIATIAEGSDIIDVLALDEFVEGYPRLRLKRTEEGRGEEYTIAVLVRGDNGTTIEKKRFYVDEGMESAKDPRPLREKMAYLQTPSLLDFTILQLQVGGYREGMYDKATRRAYGYEEETNTYVSLGTQAHETVKGGYNRELEFRSLGYEARDKLSENLSFVKCASTDELELEPKLKEIIETKRTGIVILDSLVAPDLINSDFMAPSLTKAVMYTGIEFPHNKPNLLLTSLEGRKKAGIVNQIKNLGYNMVIDDDDKLNLSEVVTLGQSTLVIISKKVDDIQSLFNLIEQEDAGLYRQFVDSLLYMGSLDKKTGMVLTATNRYLLKERDFYSFGEVLDTTRAIQVLLGMLVRPDLDKLSIREGTVKVTSTKDKEKALTSVTVSDKQITNFLWEIANPEEQKVMIKQLDEIGIFSTIYKVNTEEGSKLIKVTVFKSEMGLNLQATRLVEPTTSGQSTAWCEEGTVTVFAGKRGSGKTSHLKKLAIQNHKGKSVLVVDEDFDFDHNEFEGARNINIFRNPESVKMNLIKTLNPDVVIINTNVTKDYLIDIFESINPKSKIFVASTYDLIQDIVEGGQDTYRTRNLGNMICERAYVVRLGDGGYETVCHRNGETPIITMGEARGKESVTTAIDGVIDE